MASRWDFKFHEAAQNSLKKANQFLSLVNKERSVEQVSHVGTEAINEFKKLLFLLQHKRRIRKGPCSPESQHISCSEFMELPSFALENVPSNPNPSQALLMGQFFTQQTNRDAACLATRNGFYMCGDSGSGLTQFSQTSLDGSRFGGKSEDTGSTCVASTGGCHCSKRK